MEGLQRGDPGSVGGYQLLGRLGSGGMGQVFLGVSPGGRRVAVKLIHPVHAGTEHFRERFAREIEAARRVGGFHTAPVVDADPHADPPWMVTAYIDGPSLEEAVRRYGPLPPGRVRALGAGLAEGLAAIHVHGLVHRDLKPGNVIMAEDGPRIIDFGIARALDATGLTSTGMVVGTFAYMSPEQIRGDSATPAMDVFSLGCVLAFAATGRPPFGSDTAPAVMFRIVGQPPDLTGLADADLLQLIEGCLAKAPEDRLTVPAILAALTGRGPALATQSTPGHAAPAADGRDAQDRTNPPAWTPAATGPGPSTAPPPRTAAPAGPGHARPLAGRPRGGPNRRRSTAVVAVAVVAVAAAVVLSVLLTRGTPPSAAAGHSPSTGPGPSSQGTAHSTGTPSTRSTTSNRPSTNTPSTGPSIDSSIPARDFTLRGPPNSQFSDVAFSPDGRLLAAGNVSTGPTYVWDVATGGLTSTFSDSASGGVNALAFSPNGKFLATADGNNAADVWDVATGQHTATFADPGGGALYGVAVSADNALVATGEGNRHVVIWNVATGQLTLTLTVASSIQGMAFSPDGKLLAAAGHPAFLWNVATGQRFATFYDPGTQGGQGVNDVAFSPDSKLLATADSNGNAYIWNVTSGGVIATLNPGRGGNMNGVAFSPDGTLLAAADSNHHAYVWDVATGKLVGNFGDPTKGQVSSVAFSPDGRLLAIADWNGNIYVRVTSQLLP